MTGVPVRDPEKRRRCVAVRNRTGAGLERESDRCFLADAATRERLGSPEHLQWKGETERAAVRT